MPNQHLLRNNRLDNLLQVHRKRSLVMGILNITPDSFSDGGEYFDAGTAAKQAFRLIEEGADLLDIGGESTRPGAQRISAEEQIRRIRPVLEAVRCTHPEITLSVDTTRTEVAQAAFDSGADIVNDISALRESSDLADFVSRQAGGLILMHMRGDPLTMQLNTDYLDIVSEVKDFLAQRAKLAMQSGLSGDRIWIDPGIGFGKSCQGNLEMIRSIGDCHDLGHPVVVGVSRKSFIGKILDREPKERLAGTLAVISCLESKGVKLIHRVHDVGAVRDFLRMTEAMRKEAS